MNPHDLDYAINKQINEKAQKLEQILKSDVIYFSGAIHPQNFRAFRNFIEEVKSKTDWADGSSISIVLRTYGGSAEATERYVNVVRHHYNTVNFIVPDVAMSAGTIFCMSGDQIYMDYSSTLGPIDPQVLTSDGSAYVAALGYLDKINEIMSKDDLSAADVVFLRSADLGKLALYEQARDLSIDLLKTWLVQYKFKNWTQHRTTNVGSPVTSSEKAERAEQIATALSDHKRWFSHGRSIDLKKLRDLRLEIEDYSQNQELRDAIRSYSDLLSGYADRLGMTFVYHHHKMENL